LIKRRLWLVYPYLNAVIELTMQIFQDYPYTLHYRKSPHATDAEKPNRPASSNASRSPDFKAATPAGVPVRTTPPGNSVIAASGNLRFNQFRFHSPSFCYPRKFMVLLHDSNQLGNFFPVFFTNWFFKFFKCPVMSTPVIRQ